LLIQIISAVKYLHQMGIVHRDLKPENILLASPAEDAPLKICDFGLSKRVDVAACAAGRERLWSKCGSPDYVAPEVLGASGYGPGCDVWSCGVILYVLLSGNAPFGQTSIAAKLQHVRRAEFTFPDSPWRSISLSAQDLVKRMMEPSVTERYSCCDCLEHAWARSFLEDQLSKDDMPSTQCALVYIYVYIQSKKKVEMKVGRLWEAPEAPPRNISIASKNVNSCGRRLPCLP